MNNLFLKLKPIERKFSYRPWEDDHLWKSIIIWIQSITSLLVPQMQIFTIYTGEKK